MRPDNVPNSLARTTHVCYTSNGVPVESMDLKKDITTYMPPDNKNRR
ncbi:hypothetical protein KDA_28630 [Dictyobacter alpinus]|uniref:Uncharacterized protein n=1 Tax=Dictyobacter alpinus TaxID=2014873 RepID=A0A402B7T0_9CHLR|nr:hypothetical protein KDA_28630 [Dictyobacter alpinus]